MKIPKEIKSMPWPKELSGGTAHYRVSVAQPVVGGERWLVVSFVSNKARENGWSWRSTSKADFRVVCSKKQKRAAVLKRNGRTGLRWTLRKIMGETMDASPYSCYTLIEAQDEKALGKWLGEDKTNNHYMDELDTWMGSAIEAENQLERDARGELRDEDVYLCPEELPQGLADHIRREILPTDHILIYKKGGIRGLCYRCREHVRVSPGGTKFRQYTPIECPNCGEKMVAILEHSASDFADWVCDVVTIQRGTDGQTVFVRQWRLGRDPTARWESIEDQLEEVARYAVRGNRAAKWQCEAKVRVPFATGVRCRLANWARMNNVADAYGGSYKFCLLPLWRDTVAGTSLQYCDLEGYIRTPSKNKHTKNPIRLLVDWARYPAIEKLWKAGYTELVHERVVRLRKEHRNTISWGKNSIREAIAFPTRLLKSKRPDEWTVSELQKIKDLWPEVEVGRIREGELRDMMSINLPLKDFEAALAHTTVRQVARYIEKCRDAERVRRRAEDERLEAEGKPRYPWGGLYIESTYRDYLRDCVNLELDLSDKAVLFPRDLDAAHQRTIGQAEYKADEGIREAFRAQVEKLERWSWESGALLIHPARDSGELAVEGKALSHCVGGYAARMAKGETAIFFVRRKDAEETPFYTLELKGKTIIQCRTKNNKGYADNEEVRTFVEAWLEKIVHKGDEKKKTAATAA